MNFGILFNPINLIVFLTVMTVLIAAHEYGHYLFARWFKMEVEEFAIGFGNPKWIFRRKRTKIVADPKDPTTTDSEHETVFTLRILPLGGFVRTKGMTPEEDGSEIKIPNGFFSKSPFKRFLVYFAGPLFSVLAGYMVLIPLYSLNGVVEADPKPLIGGMETSRAGYKAGLREGDLILKVDDKPVQSFYEVVSYLRDKPGQSIKFFVERKGEPMEITAVPEKDAAPTPVLGPDLLPTEERKIQGKLGMRPATTMRRLSLGEATQHAVALPFIMFQGIWDMFRQPQHLAEKTGGVVTVYMTTSGAMRMGWTALFELCGLLSISLGVFNLLPIGPLDGGQMLISLTEMLRGGRRLSYKVQLAVLGTGFAVIAGFILFVTVNDIYRWFGPNQPKMIETKTEQK